VVRPDCELDDKERSGRFDLNERCFGETFKPFRNRGRRDDQLILQPLDGAHDKAAMIRNSEEMQIEPEGTSEALDPILRNERRFHGGPAEPGTAHASDDLSTGRRAAS
jgi:hypothetical protein